MKCIESEIGHICKKGFLFKTIRQTSHRTGEIYEFPFYEIKKLLKSYLKNKYKKHFFYGLVESEDNGSYPVWFNFESIEGSMFEGIKIGCKWYNKETVERAIKTFL